MRYSLQITELSHANIANQIEGNTKLIKIEGYTGNDYHNVTIPVVLLLIFTKNANYHYN